jgi:hypothetical protein
MLYSLAGQQETVLPHKDDFDASQKNLSNTEKQLVREIFENLIDSDKSHNSAILGAKALKDDEVLKVLLKKAAGGDKERIGILFGLYLYNAFIEHKAKWIFKRSSRRNGPGGYTYWRDGYNEPGTEEL